MDQLGVVARGETTLPTTLASASLGRRVAEGASTPLDALVLDGRLRQSLTTVRSLGRQGLAVAAVERTPDAIAFASRWCRHRWVCEAGEGTDAYWEAVERHLIETPARALIPMSDATVDLLRRYRQDAERHTAVALAREAALAIAVNKPRTLGIAASLGIRVPRQAIARSVDDVPVVIAKIGLPAVVKPSESWQHQGTHSARLVCALVTSPDEARAAIAALTQLGGDTLVQQYLPGRRDAVSLLHAHGRIYARFAQTATRTCPPLGGESVLRQSIPLPRDITEQAEALVRTINLEGYAEVEFRADAAGVPHLMEINPRLSASVEIAVRAGVDFPLLLYRWATGGPLAAVAGYRTGLWMRCLAGDIMTTYASFRERGRPGVAPPARSLVDFGLTCLRPMRYDGFDWTDPRPALRATATFVQKVGSGCLRAVQRAR